MAPVIKAQRERDRQELQALADEINPPDFDAAENADQVRQRGEFARLRTDLAGEARRLPRVDRVPAAGDGAASEPDRRGGGGDHEGERSVRRGTTRRARGAQRATMTADPGAGRPGTRGHVHRPAARGGGAAAVRGRGRRADGDVVTGVMGAMRWSAYELERRPCWSRALPWR